MKPVKAKWDRPGPQAIDPKCYGLDFLFVDVAAREPFEMSGDTAIVTIEGPLTHHADWFCDSYDAIVGRVEAALASKATNVLLVIDSPGGECSGCFDAARSIREKCEAADKPLRAFVDGNACSGGYALACSADEIAISETSFVGSIGVIAALVDATRLDAMFGMKYTLVTSGARKADGNPHEPTSEGAIKALSADVASLAGLFYAWVAESRPLEADAVRALEAGVMHGQAAVDAGLADVVTNKAAFLASIASGDQPRPSADNKGESAMGWKEDMKKAADDGDEEAKKALAALEDDENEKKDAEKEEGDEDKDKKDAKKAKAEGDDDKKDDDDKKSEASASVQALNRVGEVERELASFKAEREERERSELLRDLDLTPGQVKILRAQPLEAMKKTLEAFAPAKKTAVDPAAASRVSPTRGATQGTGGSHGLGKDIAADIDAKMGLAKRDDGPRWEGKDRIYPGPTMSKEKAREVLETNRKAGRGISQ